VCRYVADGENTTQRRDSVNSVHRQCSERRGLLMSSEIAGGEVSESLG
jgi:hypothetical protein